MPPPTCLRILPYKVVAPASQRYQSDRTDNRPRTPEIVLKARDSEATNVVQQKKEIKDQQKKSNAPAKTDMLEEKELSKTAQRKVNWGILKTMVKYIWPKVSRYCNGANERIISVSESEL